MNVPCKPWPPSPRSQPPGGPAWVDPRLIMTLTAVRIAVVETDAVEAKQVCPPDPKRVAVGFGIGNQSSVYVGPIPDPTVGGWHMNPATNQHSLWFSLLEFGPLVNLGWNVSPTSGVFVTVYEIYRLQ